VAFLRFHRDRRGYEHFYLVEPTTTRRGKTRARVLYWFRSPPNVKVGREPFDEDVRRALEAQNPGVAFDWRKISETPIPSADAERWRERRRQERAVRAAQRAAGAEPEPDLGEPEEEDIELPKNAAPDLAVDAAEQQADALALTEESLVSIAATVDPPVTEPVQPRQPVHPRPDRHRRRRRRRRPQPTERHAEAASTEPSRSGSVEAGQLSESREPGEPRGPDKAREPDEPHEPGEPHDV
jgi:hypothetical protein